MLWTEPSHHHHHRFSINFSFIHVFLFVYVYDVRTYICMYMHINDENSEAWHGKTHRLHSQKCSFFKMLFVCAHVTVLVILVVGCYLVVYACVIFPRNTYILTYTLITFVIYTHGPWEKLTCMYVCRNETFTIIRRSELYDKSIVLIWFSLRFVSYACFYICHIAKWNTEEEEFLLIILLFFFVV